MKEESKYLSIGFVAGGMIGVLVSMILLGSLGRDPQSFFIAMKPAIQAAGMPPETDKASDLARALNPCITKGELPEGCAKYVHDGIVTQPPIRIVLDTSK